MVTSEQGKHDIQQLCLVGTTVITCIIGLLIHFFIVVASVIDWLKKRPLTTTDLLITAMGTSRILFQFISLLYLFWITFCEKPSTAFMITIGVVGNFSTECNIWLAVLVSVFYSLKISNFHNILFQYLRKIISQGVYWLIITCVLLSIGYSSAECLTFFVNIPKNSTQENNLHGAQYIIHSIFMLWSVLPFLVYVISSFVLLGFLCHHIYKMKHSKKATRQLDAYFRTVKFIIVSLFCFALYVTGKMFGVYLIGSAGAFLFGNCLLVLHSIYLIYMTARLRSYFFKILHGMARCLHLSGASESRPRVQIKIISQ